MAEATDFVRQAGVLAVRGGQLCLVTSSNGRRWVIPKGMIDPGHTPAECATQEAWEEAGLRGRLDAHPVGSYVYEKAGLPHHVIVFVLDVGEVADAWPEQGLRQRTWVSPAVAAQMLEDEGLRELVQAACGEPGA